MPPLPHQIHVPSGVANRVHCELSQLSLHQIMQVDFLYLPYFVSSLHHLLFHDYLMALRHFSRFCVMSPSAFGDCVIINHTYRHPSSSKFTFLMMLQALDP